MKRIKGLFSLSSVSCYLLTFVILTILLIPLSNITNLFAQNTSKSDNEILVCNFVQYCSNPIVMNMTLTQSDIISQTKTVGDVQTSTNSTIPDVVSNISIMITPDLYNHIAR